MVHSADCSLGPMRERVDLKSPVREYRPPGSLRGAPGNRCPRIGVYVPPEGATFAAMVGNIPRKYMRAHIMAGSDTERWQCQLPDIRPGQRISFRLVKAPVGSGVPPQFIRARDPGEVVENRREARRLHAKAKREMAAKK